MKYIQFTKDNVQEVKDFINNYFNEIDEEIYLRIIESSRDGVSQIDFKYKGCLLQLKLNNYVLVCGNKEIKVVTETEIDVYLNKPDYNFSKYYNNVNKYFYIAPYGNVSISRWDDNYIDKEKYNNCNFFKDRKTAEEFAKIQLLQRKLLHFSLENGMNEIDWKNCDTRKYFIYYDSNNRTYNIGKCFAYRGLNEICFKDKETAEKALELFKNDLEEVRNIKW